MFATLQIACGRGATLIILQAPTAPSSLITSETTHTQTHTHFNAVYVCPNVGLHQLSPAVLLLIFQNQGFDRLSEFPKIREAIIVCADGWQRAGGFQTIQRRDCMALILASKSRQCICFPPPPFPTSSKQRRGFGLFCNLDFLA